jgi:hypothetical protein
MSYTGTVPYYRFMLSEDQLDLLVRTLAIALRGDTEFDVRERAVLENLRHDFYKAPEADEVVQVCAVHHVPMVRMAGKHGPFWSCHERMANGSFCSYRPAAGT